MRTLSFVENVEFEYNGNIYSKAMTCGDVDNDCANELIIGNVHGEILIFKGSSHKPWRKCCELGMVTCLEIGDICNHGMNYVVTLSVEGWCHVISVQPDSPQKDGECADGELKPVHKQQLFANNKAVLIADVDGDGRNELVVAYTDRRVRCFRWQESEYPDLAAGPTAPSPTLRAALQGKFVTLETWNLAGQIGSVTINKKKDGTTDLMASQPGGTYVTLIMSAKGQGQHSQGHSVDNKKSDASVGNETTEKDMSEGEDCGPSVIYHPLGSARSRNPCITTELVANISRKKKTDETFVPNYSAICTLDGTITLVDVDGKILWSLYVDHQLFTLTKLDITNDGTEEVVACSWDGYTYFINLKKDAVRFHFEENVAAFCAGYYAVEGKKNVPCLIYATFNNQVKVFYNIRIPHIGMSSLLDTMRHEPEVERLLAYFNCDPSNTDKVRQLYHWCLYGYQPKTT